MGFSKTIYKNEIVFIIDEKIVDDSLIKKILKEIKPQQKVGLNMKKVESVNSKYLLKGLIENKFKLFNLKNEIIMYLAIILKDGFLKSYMNIDDFKNNKRELFRRKLYIV